ncbi:MAG: putative membrane protein insertion efficiency factor [Candidatus Anoxychlamydiales bacterium]|nr:putative membrane protein insertion efficiency factor [Candidatus Anoxychlamydiales bacterium]
MVFKMRFFFIIIFLPSFIFSKGYIEPWGKDSNLKITEKKEKRKSSFLTKAFDKVIVFHQKVLSPVDGPRSHFRPTSSRYMQLAMQRYGFFKGYIMGCDRLLRENKEAWVYRKIVIDNIEYKFDPAFENKYIR